MPDYLHGEMIDECLSRHFPELWSSASQHTIYCQQNARGAIELYGNVTLTLSAPTSTSRHPHRTAFIPWIMHLDAIEPLSAVIVARQDLFATVLGCARRQHWHSRILRVVQQGDGQTPVAFGIEAEQAVAKRILDTRNSGLFFAV